MCIMYVFKNSNHLNMETDNIADKKKIKDLQCIYI